jgi:uncharacterized protein DUF1573
MKIRIILLLLITIPAVPAISQNAKNKLEGPVITFQEPSHDFGDIYQGDKVNYTFKFENTGNLPLVLSNVLVQCGCTATEWSREPISPGRSGKISVSFDSSGKIGRQSKVITIVSNADNTHERVKILTNILPKN